MYQAYYLIPCDNDYNKSSLFVNESKYLSFFKLPIALCYLNIAKDYIIFLFPPTKFHAADQLNFLTFSTSQVSLALITYQNILNYKSQNFDTFNILSITSTGSKSIKENHTIKLHDLIFTDNKLFKKVIRSFEYCLLRYQRQNLIVLKLHNTEDGKYIDSKDGHFKPSAINFQMPFIKVLGHKNEVTSIVLARAVRCLTTKHTLALSKPFKNNSDTFKDSNGNNLLTSNVTFRMGALQGANYEVGSKRDFASSSLVELHAIEDAIWRWGYIDVRQNLQLQLWYSHISCPKSQKFPILLIDLTTSIVRQKSVNIPHARSGLTQDVIEIELNPSLMSSHRKGASDKNKIVLQFFLSNQDSTNTWFSKLKRLSRLEIKILRHIKLRQTTSVYEIESIVNDITAYVTDRKVLLARSLAPSKPMSLCDLSRVYIYYAWQNKPGKARLTPHCTMIFSRLQSSNKFHRFLNSYTTLHLDFSNILDLKQFIDRLLMILKYQRNIGMATPSSITQFRPLRKSYS